MDIQAPTKEYKTSNSIIYSCQYHVIWTTKFRRDLLNEEVQERLKELVKEKESVLEFSIIEMEVMVDHVHLLLSVNPQIGICKVVNGLKGYTSNVLRKEFKHIKSRVPTLWTRSKFISTCGAVSLETVKRYIEDQKNV